MWIFKKNNEETTVHINTNPIYANNLDYTWFILDRATNKSIPHKCGVHVLDINNGIDNLSEKLVVNAFVSKRGYMSFHIIYKVNGNNELDIRMCFRMSGRLYTAESYITNEYDLHSLPMILRSEISERMIGDRIFEPLVLMFQKNIMRRGH